MRSRIIQHRNNIVIYDFMTQHHIKNCNKVPIISFLDIKIKNMQIKDAKQTCLNLVAIQLLGNKFLLCKSQENIRNFSLKSTGINAYFILENIALIAYKKNILKMPLKQGFFNSSRSLVCNENFLRIIEYFSLDSKVLKLLEKTSSTPFKIIFSYQIKNSLNNNISLYFLKSLGFPY
uniref:Uncharacterized protein n=1 Tax=Porphyra crispata TaxID=671081 RepID=A0A8F8PMA4_9RHOD|nr:hypothetical protein [Porphyra crispata]